MSLLDKLKSVLGGGSNRESSSSNAASGAAGTTTTANTSSESAVKDPVTTTPSSSSTEPSIDDAGVEAPDETPDTTDAITEAESDGEEDGAGEAESASSGTPVSEISGIGPAYSDRLGSIGIETVEQLAEAEPDDIASQTDISIGRISNWIERARNV